MLARIDDGETVRLACDLIRIPSFTTEETACAEWLASYLAGQGLEVELQEIEPGRKQTIARLRGTGGGKSIMLNGHIDIDPLASGWTRDPFDPWIADGKLFGHGVYNMKGGVAACIMAALAHPALGGPDPRRRGPGLRGGRAERRHRHAPCHRARRAHRHGGGGRALRRLHHPHQAHGHHGRGRAHPRPRHPHQQEGARRRRHREHDAGHRRALRDALHVTRTIPTCPGSPA